MSEQLKEKCAVAGVVLTDESQEAAALTYEGLYAMQHRGAEASGIASITPDGRLEEHRQNGLVRDVYGEADIQRLAGSTAIGHDRYSTSGSKKAHPQPFVDVPIGYAFAHNGNLPVTDHLDSYLEKQHIRAGYFNDSERAGLAIAQYIRNGQSLPNAVELTYPMLRGAFSCVAMHDGMVVAFRDPKGIRPLALGSLEYGHMVASETCGLDIVDATYEREVQPGEMVIITKDGVESKQLSDGEAKLDMFEFVYFARHDSMLYARSVNEVRRHFGKQLAVEHGHIVESSGTTLVVPVPDTSVPAAEGFAEELGLPHRQAIIKNRYIGRTFMQPSQGERRQQLRRKHNIIPEAVNGKDVILIDDSIVRLNTLPRLVELALQCGARSVSALIASPPVRFPDYYGIDTPQQSELAAAQMTVEQIREKTGARYLGYLSLAGMVKATGLTADSFNLSCFTGEYPIGIGHRKAEISPPVSMEYVA